MPCGETGDAFSSISWCSFWKSKVAKSLAFRSGQDSDGRLGTFAHEAAEVVDLRFEGIEDPIGATANHPFWSVDRQEFVRAGSLQRGERVLLATGDTTLLESRLPRPGPEAVYNLEVHGDHVYHVGTAGVLVHNTCPTDRAIAAARRHGGTVLPDGNIRFGSRKAARRAASEIAGDLGHGAIPIKLREFNNLPSRYKGRRMDRNIGRQSFDRTKGWRDDFPGHVRPRSGPHVNAWIDGFNFHLWY